MSAQTYCISSQSQNIVTQTRGRYHCIHFVTWVSLSLTFTNVLCCFFTEYLTSFFAMYLHTFCAFVCAHTVSWLTTTIVHNRKRNWNTGWRKQDPVTVTRVTYRVQVCCDCVITQVCDSQHRTFHVIMIRALPVISAFSSQIVLLTTTQPAAHAHFWSHLWQRGVLGYRRAHTWNFGE